MWDLGCGTGAITRLLAARWPRAQVWGLDSSPEMLATAGEEDGTVAWVEGDIASWSPPEPAGLVFANASLHWVADHARLFPALAESLAPGGVLAAQMPRNFD
ncbi:MAG: methyltransferase domain-containing protein, partial [Acidimicrobiia bacterium]|nr:methyltransferase domain-containing protein [Acidimicrobiia bacterium]